MCAVVGTWLVLRGMSFFGDAFVHGVVPGIAAAVVLDVSPALGAAVAAAAMVAGIEIVSRQTRLSEDTAIGLLFVGMLALGVVIISSVDSYTGSLTTILFGDALGVTRLDLLQQAILGGVVIVVSVVMYRPFLALSFNRQKAELLGMRPGRAHAVLLVLIATAVIGSFQSVGTLAGLRAAGRPAGHRGPGRSDRPADDGGGRSALGRLGLVGPPAQLPPGDRGVRHDGPGPDRRLLPHPDVDHDPHQAHERPR